MTQTEKQTVNLTDDSGRDLGVLVVEQRQGELLLGTFTPGADYDAVRAIFDGFAEVVDGCALSVVDVFDKQIVGLGIRAALNGHTVPTWDVQIYPDGAASCRIPPAVLNSTSFVG